MCEIKDLKGVIFEIEERFDRDEELNFEYFTRPNGDFIEEDKKGNKIRLPTAFIHWTWMITDK